MKLFIILLGLLNLANAATFERDPITGELVTEGDIEELRTEIKELKSNVKEQKNEPNKITYKSNVNDNAYKARQNCLMSEKTAEECDKLFPVVKKTFTTSYEYKNVEPEGKKEIEKSEKLESLMEEDSKNDPLSTDPIDVEA